MYVSQGIDTPVLLRGPSRKVCYTTLHYRKTAEVEITYATGEKRPKCRVDINALNTHPFNINIFQKAIQVPVLGPVSKRIRFM
jgi:diacylglycerol kinase family enzyme